METTSDQPQSPQLPEKNKGGRPKGSKNRPKWLLKELKNKPKRPVGRPKGATGKPKTLEAWLAKVEATPLDEMRKTPPKRRPKRPVHPNTFKNLIAATPEERVALAKRAQAAVSPKSQIGKRPDTPRSWTNKDWIRFCDETKREARRIFKIMDKQGMTPEDQMARKSLEAAFEMVNAPLPVRDRMAAIRTILEYTKTKPAQRTDFTIKRAEDFLDDIADDTDNVPLIEG